RGRPAPGPGAGWGLRRGSSAEVSVAGRPGVCPKALLAVMAAKPRAAGTPGRPPFPALPGAGLPGRAARRPQRAGSGLTPYPGQVLRRYTRTAMGANTTTMPTAHSTDLRAASANGPPVISPRVEVARSDIGLTSTNACSQPGIVSVGTSRLLANTSGNIAVKPKSCTPCAVLASSPIRAEIQHMASANPSTSRQPAVAASALVVIRNPSSIPN